MLTVLTQNCESASRAARPDLPMSRSSTIIEERCTMSRPAIHPGEILAEELVGFGSDADELARQLKVACPKPRELARPLRRDSLRALARKKWCLSPCSDADMLAV